MRCHRYACHGTLGRHIGYRGLCTRSREICYPKANFMPDDWYCYQHGYQLWSFSSKTGRTAVLMPDRSVVLMSIQWNDRYGKMPVNLIDLSWLYNG